MRNVLRTGNADARMLQTCADLLPPQTCRLYERQGFCSGALSTVATNLSTYAIAHSGCGKTCGRCGQAETSPETSLEGHDAGDSVSLTDPKALAAPLCCLIVKHGAVERMAERPWKREERAALRLGCSPLKFLAPRLFLFSFILADDTVMLHHWLQHYSRLGVWSTHTAIAIRTNEPADTESLKETLQLLRAANVSTVSVINSPPSDTLKIQTMNNFLERLPADAWAIYADVDELFDYPCVDYMNHFVYNPESVRITEESAMAS